MARPNGDPHSLFVCILQLHVVGLTFFRHFQTQHTSFQQNTQCLRTTKTSLCYQMYGPRDITAHRRCFLHDFILRSSISTSPNSKSDQKIYTYLKTTSMHIKCSQQSRGTLFARGLVHPPPPMTNSH